MSRLAYPHLSASCLSSWVVLSLLLPISSSVENIVQITCIPWSLSCTAISWLNHDGCRTHKSHKREYQKKCIPDFSMSKSRTASSGGRTSSATTTSVVRELTLRSAFHCRTYYISRLLSDFPRFVQYSLPQKTCLKRNFSRIPLPTVIIAHEMEYTVSLELNCSQAGIRKVNGSGAWAKIFP